MSLLCQYHNIDYSSAAATTWDAVCYHPQPLLHLGRRRRRRRRRRSARSQPSSLVGFPSVDGNRTGTVYIFSLLLNQGSVLVFTLLLRVLSKSVNRWQKQEKQKWLANGFSYITIFYCLYFYHHLFIILNVAMLIWV